MIFTEILRNLLCFLSQALAIIAIFTKIISIPLKVEIKYMRGFISIEAEISLRSTRSIRRMAVPKDINLVEQLEEAGNQLAQIPTEIDKLLPILDRVDILLSQVEQSPSQQLLDACSIAMKTLVKEPLLRHSDIDVKVCIASCVCEITRITAPEAPYEDAEMKDAFQLIVSSFKDLSDMSSRSYSKRTSILENVARVRSSVVMLDLECDTLIVEMFHNFLSSIRDYHPEIVFSSMESIMTLVIEESEDVSLELLMPILDTVKKDNKDIQTISRKLAEKVLEKCAVKVKPYMLQAVKSLGGPLSQYSTVVADMCEEAGVVEHHDDNGSVDQLDKVDDTSLDEPKADVSSLDEAKTDDTSLDVLKAGDTSLDVPETDDASLDEPKADDASLDEPKADDAPLDEPKADDTPLDEPTLVTPLDEPGVSLDVDVTKDCNAEVEAEATHQEKCEKDSQISNDARDDDIKDTLVVEHSQVNTLSSSENEKEVAQVSSPKQLDNEVVDIASEVDPDKSCSTKENPTEGTPFVYPVTVEAADASSDLEGKQQRGCENENNNSTQEDEPKKEKMVEDDAPSGNPDSIAVADRIIDSDVKIRKKSTKKIIDSVQDAPADLDSLQASDRAFNLLVKRQKRSGRKPVNLAQEDPKQEKLAQEDVKAGKSSENRTTAQLPVDDKSDETTSDSETKPLILCCRKGKKGMTANQPKVETVKQGKGKRGTAASHQVGDDKKGNGLSDTEVQQTKLSVKEGKKENAASEPEEELKKYTKKGKRDNDAEAGKGKKENTGLKAERESVKGKKRNAESDSDAELLKQSAKKRQKGDPKTNPIKQSATQEKNGTAANDPGRDPKSGKGKKRNAENESDAEVVKKSGKKGRKGTATSEQEVEPQKQSGKKEKGNVAPSHQEAEPVKQLSKKKQTNKTRGKSLPSHTGSSKDNMTDLDVKDDSQEMVSSPKSPKLASKSVAEKNSEDSKIRSNRKQITGKNKLDIEYGANLVDSKVKVWWQDDRQFYEGVIASFDSEKKKHKVVYDDGEMEILNLKKETWEFVKDGTIQHEQGDKVSNEPVLAKISSGKSTKSKRRGGKSQPGDDEPIMPKSNSKSNQGKPKSASKSNSKTPQVESKSDGKRRRSRG